MLEITIFSVDGLRRADNVGYREFLSLVLFEVHEFKLSLPEG